MRWWLFSLVICALLGGCSQSQPSTLVMTPGDEPEMDAAIARARREVDDFIQELKNPAGRDHAVKAPIQDEGETEHFWLIEVTFDNGEFHGTINNEPGIVDNVKLGQNWTVKKEDISDWMYLKGGKMYGNYTLRPLLKQMPPEDAKQLREILAEP